MNDDKRTCDCCGAACADEETQNDFPSLIEVVRDQFICEDCYRLIICEDCYRLMDSAI